MAKNLAQCGKLNGVTNSCARAVRFHIAYATGSEAGQGKGLANNHSLAVFPRCRIAHAPSAVVVGCRGEDDGIDRICVTQGVFQALEQYHAATAGKDSAAGIFVKRSAVAVRRENHAVLVEIAPGLGHVYGNATGKGHVAGSVAQVFAGNVHGGQG